MPSIRVQRRPRIGKGGPTAQLTISKVEHELKSMSPEEKNRRKEWIIREYYKGDRRAFERDLERRPFYIARLMVSLRPKVEEQPKEPKVEEKSKVEEKPKIEEKTEAEELNRKRAEELNKRLEEGRRIKIKREVDGYVVYNLTDKNDLIRMYPDFSSLLYGLQIYGFKEKDLNDDTAHKIYVLDYGESIILEKPSPEPKEEKKEQPKVEEKPKEEPREEKKARECDVRGCGQPATKTFWPDYDTELHVCEHHYNLLQQQKVEEEKRVEEERRRKEEAAKRARQLLTLKEDEIAFRERWVGEGDDSYSYITLSKRVPQNVYQELAQAGAVRKAFFEETGETYYPVNVAKATPILEKHGYKVISLAEWQAREKEAKKILREAGLDLHSLKYY
jgi:hypothetical protein